MDKCLKVIERNFLYPEGKCLELKIDLDSMGQQIDHFEISIYFKPMKNTSAKLFLTDPHRHYFLRDIFTYSGELIETSLENVAVNNFNIYRIQIDEHLELEKDTDNDCNDYKTGQFGSFKDCINFHVENTIFKDFECIPPWFTEKIENICPKSFKSEEWKNMSNLIFPTFDSTFKKVSCIILGLHQLFLAKSW